MSRGFLRNTAGNALQHSLSCLEDRNKMRKNLFISDKKWLGNLIALIRLASCNLMNRMTLLHSKTNNMYTLEEKSSILGDSNLKDLYGSIPLNNSASDRVLYFLRSTCVNIFVQCCDLHLCEYSLKNRRVALTEDQVFVAKFLQSATKFEEEIKKGIIRIDLFIVNLNVEKELKAEENKKRLATSKLLFLLYYF